MFRYKKYRLAAGAIRESPKTEEAGRAREHRRSGVRVSTQVLEPLAKGIDLSGRSILRRSFPILGEFGASKRLISLPRELGNLAGGRAGIDRRRGRRRGLQKPIHALCASSNPKARPQLLADRDAARHAMRQPQFFDNRDDGLVRDLLRSSHRKKVTVNYGKFEYIQALDWRGTSGFNEPILSLT